jgi:hypothetical protein
MDRDTETECTQTKLKCDIKKQFEFQIQQYKVVMITTTTIMITTIVIQISSTLIYLHADLTAWKPVMKLARRKYKQTNEDTEQGI